MTGRRILAVLALFACAAPLPGRAAGQLTTALLGGSVMQAVRAYGMPTGVASRNDGHHFLFDAGGTPLDTIVDADNGTIRAVDVHAAAPLTMTVDVDGKPRTFAFGSYTIAQADADLATVADYSLDAQRLYRLGPARELVLGFDKPGGTLARIIVGDRSALVRLGLFPSEPVEKAFPFVAPVPRGSGIPKDGSGSAATVVRLEVDRTGAVGDVTVIVPSDDPAFDRTLSKKLANDTYIPAKLGGRAIGASVYREIHH